MPDTLTDTPSTVQLSLSKPIDFNIHVALINSDNLGTLYCNFISHNVVFVSLPLKTTWILQLVFYLYAGSVGGADVNL